MGINILSATYKESAQPVVAAAAANAMQRLIITDRARAQERDCILEMGSAMLLVPASDTEDELQVALEIAGDKLSHGEMQALMIRLKGAQNALQSLSANLMFTELRTNVPQELETLVSHWEQRGVDCANALRGRHNERFQRLFNSRIQKLNAEPLGSVWNHLPPKLAGAIVQEKIGLCASAAFFLALERYPQLLPTHGRALLELAIEGRIGTLTIAAALGSEIAQRALGIAEPWRTADMFEKWDAWVAEQLAQND